LNTIDTSGLAVDPRSLDDLRVRAVKDPDGTLEQAALQFETLFLDMMLKSMRSAAPGDSLFDSEVTKTFTGLLDHEFARKLAAQGGLGLADLLLRQLALVRGDAVKKTADLPITKV
jgi:peptidoglycan hydrolase FlgJ